MPSKPLFRYISLTSAGNTFNLSFQNGSIAFILLKMSFEEPLGELAAVAPVAAVAPIAPEVTSSQYRAEDEAGNTAYGYQNINNAAEQRGTANGNGVTGSYSYVDEAGHHSVSYIADDLGYRVIGRTRRSAQVAPVAYAGPHLVGAVAPAAYAAVAPAAVAVAAPAAPAREAVLTTIKLNPGHAVFYRVD